MPNFKVRQSAQYEATIYSNKACTYSTGYCYEPGTIFKGHDKGGGVINIDEPGSQNCYMKKYSNGKQIVKSTH